MSSQLPSQRIEVASERGVQVTWWYTVFSIVFLLAVSYAIVPTAILAQSAEFSAAHIGYLVVIAGIFAASLRYCWLLKAGLGSGLPPLRFNLLLIAPAVVSLVLAALAAPGNPFLLLPAWWAGSLIVVLLPRHRLLILLALMLFLLLIFIASAALTGNDLADREYLSLSGFLFYFWFMALMVPSVVIAGMWWWRIVVQLNISRKTFGDLSVAKERLRFAADLHDIQGHHLQVIALKTELAERLMDRDPELAKQQIHEAQVLARTAMEDTRALVRGYRQVAFTTELKNAADIFEAASIGTTIQNHDVELNNDQGSLFGSVMREATTNILRHANARKVAITLRAEHDLLWLSISNDGADVEPAGSPAAGTGMHGTGLHGTGLNGTGLNGTGLTALAERLESAGGGLEFREEAGIFTVTARIPEAL